MTINDLRKKYIGKQFTVKSDGQTGRCIHVKGYRKAGKIVIRFCIWLKNGPAVWFSSDEIQPIKETLF